MDENAPKSNKRAILLLGLLILLLAAAVQFIFLGLERVLPQTADTKTGLAEAEAQAVSVPVADCEEAPGFCPNCGKKLREGFRWGQFCPYCGEKVE